MSSATRPDENSSTLINSDGYGLCLRWWQSGYEPDCFPSDGQILLFGHMRYEYQSWKSPSLNCLLFFDQLYKLYMMKKGRLGPSIFHPILFLRWRRCRQDTQCRGGAALLRRGSWSYQRRRQTAFCWKGCSGSQILSNLFSFFSQSYVIEPAPTQLPLVDSLVGIIMCRVLCLE